jgi:hypothetical protein
VTSVAQLTGRPVPLAVAAGAAARLFGEVFDRAMAAVPAATLWALAATPAPTSPEPVAR